MDNQLNSGFGPNYFTLSHPWFKTKWFKITLTALGIVAVVLIVLFNRQIGDLLKNIVSKAALQTSNIVLQGDSTQPGYFLGDGYTADRWEPGTGWVLDPNAVKVDPATNRLMLNLQ